MDLSSLTDNQRLRLISLPYRAGLYISESDQSCGDAAAQNELRALESLIYGFADGVFGSELVQNIMAETIKNKESWPEWGHGLDQVPHECGDALSILQPYVDHKERSAYVVRIMDIGEAVALAFREDIASQSGFGRFKAYVGYRGYVKHMKKKKMPVRPFEDYLSISMDERNALQSMAEAFGTTYV